MPNAPLHAGPVLTFEGIQNFEAVANYYNGGMGSQGTGPGPSYGITFGAFAVASIPGQTEIGNSSTVSFSGTALSVVFDGGNNQLALGDISFFAPVPEPSTMVLLIASLPFLLILWRRGRNTRANQYFL